MTSPRWVAAICACLIIATVGCFQVFHHSYDTEFANYPDEAAHFVTGVCALDYLTTAFGSNPRTFVEAYYVRYPKVAFGHWPPLFYGLQAIWYALWGTTAFNAMLLVGAIAALAAVVLFLRLRRGYGGWTAAFAIAVFLWLPEVRNAQQLLMTDMLAGLFVMLAVFSCCDALDEPGVGRWLAFALWASAAVLTKESGWMLALFAPAAWIAFKFEKPSRRTVLTFAIAAILVLLIYKLGGVWSFRNRPFSGEAAGWWSGLRSEGLFFSHVSPLVFLVAAYGIFSVIRRWKARRSGAPAVLWLGIALLVPLVRGGDEPRYFLLALFPLIVLFAEGLHASRMPIFANAAVAALCVVTMPQYRLSARTGYREIAASIPYDSLGPSILVASDAAGEGALIAERLMHDQNREGVVLRGSKVLRSSDWMGGYEKLLAQSTEGVRGLLDSIPVNYVVLDMNGFANESTRLLARAIEEAPGQFRRAGVFPLYFDGHRRDRSVEVYENLAAQGRRPGHIRIGMEYTLRRDLNIPLKRGGNPVDRRVAEVSTRLASFLDKPRPKVDAPVMRIDPGSEDADAEGDAGRIYVTAPRRVSWAVSSVPPWIALAHSSGTGDGEMPYVISKNTSNEPRSADLSIGGKTFPVRQPQASLIYIPFLEKFTGEPHPAGRWILEDPAAESKLVLSADAPVAGSSLVIDKARASSESWTTRLVLPGVVTKAGTKYRVSMWLKAENPGLVTLEFSCGAADPIWVPSHWMAVSVPITTGPCSGGQLALGAGRIAGKLWVAEVSLIEDAAQDGPGKQADRKRQPLKQVPF